MIRRAKLYQDRLAQEKQALMDSHTDELDRVRVQHEADQRTMRATFEQSTAVFASSQEKEQQLLRDSIAALLNAQDKLLKDGRERAAALCGTYSFQGEANDTPPEVVHQSQLSLSDLIGYAYSFDVKICQVMQGLDRVGALGSISDIVNMGLHRMLPAPYSNTQTVRDLLFAAVCLSDGLLSHSA